jgi:CheY-like chemotaxis protein
LESEGHTVVAVDIAAQGIATFRSSLQTRGKFAAVITDLGMPHMDGRQVSRAIKAASPATPVILLTGWGQPHMMDDETPATVDRVLSKPPKLGQLREALTQLCAKGSDDH